MKRFGYACLTAAVLLLALWALAPGSNGGFLFDDYVNLPALGHFNGVRDWRTFLLYITSSTNDPVGRPLSLLSFLLDATNWPASPAPFLRTNIALHLVNGLLLAAVLRALGRARGWEDGHASRAALLAAAIWLLHPLFLSTTLYIVQREAMLAAAFTLLGLRAWFVGRERLQAGRTRSACAWLVFGAWVCTALATLCKANGLLLPLLLAMAEATVLADTAPATHLRRARRLLLGLPLAALAALLLGSIPGFVQTAIENRPWTLSQRLLTEPRVLVDYLAQLAVPHPVSRGVFHDEFAASTDLFHPWTTLPSLLLIVATIAAAVAARRKWPVPAFAVLFYFGGQLLESTFVPLELYFEHRNYLPAMMLFWPIAGWLSDAHAPLARVRAAAAVALLALLAFDTRLGALTWSDPQRLAHAWVERNPDSPRAQAYAARFELIAGKPDIAARRLSAALTAHPDEAQLAFGLIDAQCSLDGVSPELAARAEAAVRQDAKAAALDFAWLSAAVPRARAGDCRGLDLAAVSALVDAAGAVRAFAQAPGRIQDFEHVRGLLRLAANDPVGAAQAFDRALAALPQPAVALDQAALLGDAGRADLGLAHLDAYLAAHPLAPPRIGPSAHALHAWLLYRYDYWRSEFERMRNLLSQQNPDPIPPATPPSASGGAA